MPPLKFARRVCDWRHCHLNLIVQMKKFSGPKSSFWLMLLLSPAFIFGYSFYGGYGHFHPFQIIALLIAILAATKFRLYSWFSLPFVMVVFVSMQAGVRWTIFDFSSYEKAPQFYAGFLILLFATLAPLAFVRIKKIQTLHFIMGFMAIFSLIGLGLDWDYCLFLFCTFVYLTLFFNIRSTEFKTSISKVSTVVVVLYVALWNIPCPYLGIPGLGIYGAIYNAYPRLEMQDPLKHPFWREAGERYQKVRVGTHRNGLPPESSKLEFLLKRSGIKNIEFLPSPNFEVLTQPSDSDTFILLDEWSTSPSMRLKPDTSVDLLARIDGYLVYAPGWKVCKACREIAKDLQIDSLPADVSLNKPISFAKGGEGVELLGAGWSQPEAWGVWSDGNLARIYIPKPAQTPKKLFLDLRAFVSPEIPVQDVSIFLNDQFAAEYKFDKGEGNLLPINLPVGTENFYKIGFQLKTPARPSDLGLSKDRRLLGIGLVSAKLE